MYVRRWGTDAGFLTQIDTDELRWDTIFFNFIIICTSSVFITVHLWFLSVTA